MVTFFITSLFVLAFLAIALYFWQKPSSSSDGEPLLSPPGRGLFIDGTPESQALVAVEAEATATAAAAAKRTELVERAKAGEKATLGEAVNTGDARLYEEILNLLLKGADSNPKLLSLVSYVTRHELRVNKTLADRVRESYKHAPDRHSTATMLHLAALSDDAEVYQDAVETALSAWEQGQIPEVSASELRSILNGEFWVLSNPTRSSGAGFLLKRTLAKASRKLEAAPND